MLLVVLLVLAILTERGSIALTTTVTDLTQTYTERTAKQAFSSAEGGIEEAKGRLMGKLASNPNFIGDPAAPPNKFWSAYILTFSSWTTAQDYPDYNAAYTNYFPTATSQINTVKVVNSLQTTIPYWIKIRHKLERDAELEGHTPATPHYFDDDGVTTGNHTATNPGNIIYYGYYPAGATTPVQFTASATAPNAPVELVRAYVQVGTVVKSIEVDMAQEVGPPIVAPIYMKGNMMFISSATGDVRGTDNCGAAAARPPVYTLSPGTTTGTPPYQGNPATPQQGMINLNLSAYIKALKGGATVLKTDQLGESGTQITFGTATDPATIYSDTLHPPNEFGLELRYVDGYGTLLVDGDLTLAKDTNWYGLIIATGVLTTNASSGTVDLRGAMLAGSGHALEANPELRYDSCQVAAALRGKPLNVIRWKYRP